MINKLLDMIVDRLMARVGPLLNDLVRTAVDEAVSGVADEVENRMDDMLNAVIAELKHLPVIGAFLK